MSVKPAAGQKYLRSLANRTMLCKNNCDIQKGDECLQAFVGTTLVPNQPVYCKDCAFPNNPHKERLTQGDIFGIEFNYSSHPSLDIYDGNGGHERFAGR